MASRVITAITAISKISERVKGQLAALVVIAGNDLGKKLELSLTDLPSGAEPVAPKVWTIGRSSRADLRIDQESVSRKHAQVVGLQKDFELVDLGSTNGTYVNDRRVKGKRRLKHGDLIKFGRTVVKFIASKNLETAYHEEVYRLTTVDALTQVFNRRYFEDSIAREVSRCRRHHRPLSLILIDVDRFKAVNDEHGHLGGDEVLKHLAASILRQTRREDILARYGGEEFALLLPEVSLEGAVALAEKIRRQVEQSVVTVPKSKVRVTISLGVAQLQAPGDVQSARPVSPKGKAALAVRRKSDSSQSVASTEAQALLLEADTQLYRAKRSGRNQVSHG